MTQVRGQVRGPHWGRNMDNMLIDFWRKHDCLFNSSVDSYYDKDLKTKLWTEFALSVGKSVSDVERRSRSLRTQYGRVLWHPERVCTAQQEMLREKLSFLKPYIVRRRADCNMGDRFEEPEEENEETEGSSFSSPLGAAAPEDEAPPLVSDVMSLSEEQPDHDVLKPFAEVLLADMRLIRDPLLLLRLRRDITDLVCKAAEEDQRRRSGRLGEGQVRGTWPQVSPGNSYSWRQKFLKRKGRSQRWEELRLPRRGPSMQPVQQGQETASAQVNQEIKREAEPHLVKIEDEELPSP